MSISVQIYVIHNHKFVSTFTQQNYKHMNKIDTSNSHACLHMCSTTKKLWPT